MMINERLKSIRQSLNISQQEFSNSLGLEQGSYSGIESGRKGSVTKQTAILLEMVYNINIEFLYTGKGSMFKSDSPASGILYTNTVGVNDSSIGGDMNGNIIGNNLTNVGNVRHYQVPKKGFLKIIHPDGSEEDIVGDAGLLEVLNDYKMVKMENDYLKEVIKYKDQSLVDKDKMINLLEKNLDGK